MIPRAVMQEQLNIRSQALFSLFYWTLRVVAPAAILAIFYANL
jgi:hypothetical protein